MLLESTFLNADSLQWLVRYHWKWSVWAIPELTKIDRRRVRFCWVIIHCGWHRIDGEWILNEGDERKFGIVFEFDSIILR